MSAAAAGGAALPEGPPFEHATPAQVRAALLPEDAAEFDRQWRVVMAAATESLDLAGVHRALGSWRRVAWLTQANGPDGYRRLLARADQAAHTGDLPADSVPIDRIRALIAERLG